MKKYLEDNLDTTTEEFDQVWRTLNPETKEVCSLQYSSATSSYPFVDLGKE